MGYLNSCSKEIKFFLNYIKTSFQKLTHLKLAIESSVTLASPSTVPVLSLSKDSGQANLTSPELNHPNPKKKWRREQGERRRAVHPSP